MDFKIKKLNESTVKLINTTEELDLEISELYTYKVANYAAMKKNPRLRNWNGKICLYNKKSKTLDFGNWFHLYDTMESRGYKVDIDNSLFPVEKFKSREELETVINEFIKPFDGENYIVPYDYQVEAIHHAIEMDRSVILSATSSGKSLIIYCLVWLYKNCFLEEHDGPIVVIVPDKGLVEQLYANFSEYSEGKSENWTQKINSDYEKYVTKDVVITTWQSLVKMPELIDEASVMIVDEVHKAKAKQLTNILQNARNCKYKHGLTGTLDGVEANETLIRGLFGPVAKFVSQRELIDSGRACDVKINIVGFRYSPRLIKQYEEEWEIWQKEKPWSDKYQFEIDFINKCEERNKMLLELVDFVEGNSFVLFHRKDTHGVQLYEKYKETHDDTYLITGDIKDRTDILNEFKQKNNAVLFATSSIMSTGISVNNLHNLFFASSQKAKVATIQSIGRLMRLHESKSVAHVFDIVDIIGKNNITQKHVDERIKHYNEEQIKYEISFIDID